MKNNYGKGMKRSWLFTKIHIKSYHDMKKTDKEDKNCTISLPHNMQLCLKINL